MTRDEVIKLAKGAGFWNGETVEMNDVGMMIFADRVIADFLERTGQYVTNDASRKAVIAEAVAAEREKCALVCSLMPEMIGGWRVANADDCAAAIRARGAK